MPDTGPGEGLPEAVARLDGELAELRRSRMRLALAADADRRALERALHDGVQQNLTALAVGLQQLRGLINVDPASANGLVEDLALDVREALREATDLARRIRPPLLDMRDLVGELRSAAASAGVSAVVAVQPRKLPPELTAAIYWCWVEALSSSPAGTQATVSLRDGDQELAFDVAIGGDDPDAILQRLRDRVEAFGGRLDVRDAGDGRSLVSGSLPLAGPS